MSMLLPKQTCWKGRKPIIRSIRGLSGRINQCSLHRPPPITQPPSYCTAPLPLHSPPPITQTPSHDTDTLPLHRPPPIEKPDLPHSPRSCSSYSPRLRGDKGGFLCLDEIIERDIRTHNEYQLTDRLQLMLEYGEQNWQFSTDWLAIPIGSGRSQVRKPVATKMFKDRLDYPS